MDRVLFDKTSSRPFTPSHQRTRSHRSLGLSYHRISGPLSFFNPTRAYHRFPLPLLTEDKVTSSTDHFRGAYGRDATSSTTKEQASIADHKQPASNIHLHWQSRNNRKGRHALVVERSATSPSLFLTPQSTSSLRETARGVRRMFTQAPYWDVSYLVAITFTLGSVVWVFNAFFVWLPLVRPGTEFKDELLLGGGVTAFLGATIFEIGSVLLMFEAVNENRAECFGWAVRQSLEAHGGHDARYLVDARLCTHRHTKKRNLVGKRNVDPSTAAVSESQSRQSRIEPNHEPPEESPKQVDSWMWFPSVHELTSHYLREIGFLACLAQFCGATIFWISGLTALPGINNKMSQAWLDGIYWAPQILGGTGFILSGTLFMLETQKKWYVPAARTLGWHIGLWNLIGALGFTLCGALGPAYKNSGAEYQASLATFWGSWAFLIGSLIQWYESLGKYPVEESDAAS